MFLMKVDYKIKLDAYGGYIIKRGLHEKGRQITAYRAVRSLEGIS